MNIKAVICVSAGSLRPGLLLLAGLNKKGDSAGCLLVD